MDGGPDPGVEKSSPPKLTEKGLGTGTVVPGGVLGRSNGVSWAARRLTWRLSHTCFSSFALVTSDAASVIPDSFVNPMDEQAGSGGSSCAKR